ncbi:MAG: sugar phosphate isomerase/epimerase [Candidatus Acidiferrales bacterium]
MPPISRRAFLKTASASAAGAALWTSTTARSVLANPLGLPIGLQLYSVRDLLPKDYEGTLKQLAALGYQEVEAAGFFGHSAADVKRAMAQAGLHCVSAHYPLAQLLPAVDETIQYAKDLDLDYIICSSPIPRDHAQMQPGSPRAVRRAMTLDDWRWNAGQFNAIGARVNAAGLRFGYHNHTEEFQVLDGVMPYDELLRLTDPAKVTMEMDCGWVIVGGQNPVDYLLRYPTRISMLHVKDFQLSGAKINIAEPPPSTEMGRGSINYIPIFKAAKHADIKHAFVEQEQFDIPPMEALKIDAEYMRALSV